jgi:hypothetical protein
MAQPALGERDSLLRGPSTPGPVGRLGVDPGMGAAWNGIGTDGTYPLRLLSGWTRAAGRCPGEAKAKRIYSPPYRFTQFLTFLDLEPRHSLKFADIVGDQHRIECHCMSGEEKIHGANWGSSLLKDASIPGHSPRAFFLQVSVDWSPEQNRKSSSEIITGL